MAQAFNNNENSFNTIDSFNNNDNSLNNNDNSFNTNSFNTTFNYTTVDDRSEILVWLSPLEPRARHRDIGSRRVDSIGAWLLETEEFKRWYNGSREDRSYCPALFCDGAAGVGKSYIISLVIDRLCDEAVNGDATVACFYFDFAARNEQSPAYILGSLLRQLISGEGEIPEAVAQDFRNDKRAIGGRGLQVSGVLKMFQTMTATRRTFICVDALDECVPEYRKVILEALGQILQGSPNTRLFMTGRPNVRSEVERELGGTATFILMRATEDGVVRFLREKLRKDTIPNVMSSPLEGDIIKSIPAINSETFLPASLYIEAILRSTTIAGRRETLQLIKDGSGFGDAYYATLERIKAQGEKRATLAIAALTWICHSERPLLVDELCHALAVEIGAADFDPENIPSIGTLVDCCQGLIVVDSEASIVRLIHYTAHEYLCSHPGLFSKPHSILAETCLTFLNSQQFKRLTPDSLRSLQSMPFLKYSARYWGTHMNKDLSDHAMGLALELLYQYEGHISAVSLVKQVVPPMYRGLTTPLFSGLHCASFFGIVELVTLFIGDRAHEVDQQDRTGRTPLAWAAKNGHEGVVKILLESKNVDPNCQDMYGRTPLANASINGHEGVVKLLLERENVDPNHRSKNGRTPLASAAINGHEGVVKLLLERENVDPNLLDTDGDGPLSRAVIEGHTGVVKLLLERENVDPNHRNEKGLTPLGCAALEGHEGVVKLFLERGNVDLNLPDTLGNGPLGNAVLQGHEGVVKLLLERENVDPNLPNALGNGPLVSAALNGHTGVVKLLLGRENVDPNLPDPDGDGPLSCAAVTGHEGVVKLLLEREDVDPNRRNHTGRTPLLCAAYYGREGVVRLLLERKDVDPHRRDYLLVTPLSYATLNGHHRIAQILQARGEKRRDALMRRVFSAFQS